MFTSKKTKRLQKDLLHLKLELARTRERCTAIEHKLCYYIHGDEFDLLVKGLGYYKKAATKVESSYVPVQS